MAVVLGTNAGFVSVAPTDDPVGTNGAFDNYIVATRDTSPSGSNAVSQYGWYCDGATEEANFQIGLYSHDATRDSNNGGPNALLESSGDIAKGTTAGWKTANGSYSLAASTTYWVGAQLDDTATVTNANYTGSGKTGYKLAVTSLTDPFPTGESYLVRTYAFYAYYAAAGGGRATKNTASNQHGQGYGMNFMAPR